MTSPTIGRTEEMAAALPRLSIITISKDDPVGLAKSVASVRAQTYQNFEHILVVAGRSQTPVHSNDSRLRVINNVRPGISNALNAGVCASQGEWVQFLNGGDAFASPDSLEQMVNYANDNVAMVCAFARVLKRSFTIPRRPLRPGHDVFIYASHQASLFRKKLFDEYGLFEPTIRIRMDLEWLTRLPNNLHYQFLEKETVHFDPHGVSANHVILSSIEESQILWRSRTYRHRALAVMLLKLPFRVLRREVRRFTT